tara:strand:- start:1526 stop:1675 length:150 start_codon:yes stop_codon:yes gene_type:complete
MESPQGKPTIEEREVRELVWMRAKGACEKLKKRNQYQRREHQINIQRDG